MQAELAKPSMVTVVSAHAARDDAGRLYFCGEDVGEEPRPVLPVDLCCAKTLRRVCLLLYARRSC
jgi:hypothetical protein